MTLVSEIETILALPDRVRINKEELIKNTIEWYRNNYPLLEKVIQGETTFQETYQDLIKKNEGIKAFLVPQWVKKKGMKTYIENKDLITCDTITCDSLTSKAASVSTPLTYATILGLLGLTTPPTIPLLVTVGLIMGLPISEIRRGVKNYLKDNTKMLDEQIQKLYHKH